MKKLLFVLLVGAFAACNGGDSTSTSDSTGAMGSDTSSSMMTDTSSSSSTMGSDTSSSMMTDTSSMSGDSSTPK